MVYCKDFIACLSLMYALHTRMYTQRGNLRIVGNDEECIYWLQINKFKHFISQVCIGSVISLGRKRTSAVATSWNGWLWISKNLPWQDYMIFDLGLMDRFFNLWMDWSTHLSVFCVVNLQHMVLEIPVSHHNVNKYMCWG